MREKGVTVMIADQERFLVCTTAAYEMICEKYGDLESMVEVFQGPKDTEYDTPEAKAEKEKTRKKASNKLFTVAPWLIAALANQGEILKNGNTKPDNLALLTEEKVKLLTSPGEIKDLMQAAMQAISIGFGTEHAIGEGKRDPVLEELDRKNAEGAAE
jgi:hypothetical protein